MVVVEWMVVVVVAAWCKSWVVASCRVVPSFQVVASCLVGGPFQLNEVEMKMDLQIKDKLS